MAATVPFAAPAHLRIYLAGYPSGPNMALRLENVSNHSTFSIQVREQPREQWLPFDFSLPPSWQGKAIRIVQEDQNVGPGGWAAFSEPVSLAGGIFGLQEARIVLLRAILHFVLLMLPCFATCAIALSKGVREILACGLLALAATGIFGYLVFWLWVIWPRLGHLVAFLLPLVSAICLASVCKRLDANGRTILANLAKPALLTGAASLLVLSTGFWREGLRTPLATPARRFSHPLPADNSIPYLFAEGVRKGKVPKPLLGDWQSSDRPPLQSAIALSQYPYVAAPRALGYTILSANLQSLWILALWLVLLSLDIDKRATVLALSVCLFSGFVFINTFFVWPKLLASSYGLGLLPVILSERLTEALRTRKLLVITTGALIALGLLAHGGSMFAVLGLTITAILLRRRIPLSSLIVIAVTAFALYLPWLLYQKLYDAPGDRLLKVHLAGDDKVDLRPFSQVLMTAYGSLSVQQVLYHKSQNVAAVVDHQGEYWRAVAEIFRCIWNRGQASSACLAQAASHLRGLAFFFFIPTLGFLISGIPALLIGIGKRYRSAEWKASMVMWIFIVATAAIWCVLMFGPSTTLIHQGTYVMILLACAASLLGIWAVSPYLAAVVATLQIALNFFLYIMMMRQPVPTGVLAEGVLRYAMVALALLSLSGVLLLLSSLPRVTD